MSHPKNNFLLCSLPFIGFISGYYFLNFFLSKKEIITPNIIGKSIQNSLKDVSNKGLSLKLLRQQEDADLPEGIILDQIPKFNQKIKPNQNIFVTISKKPKPMIVPNFVGLDHREVISKAKKMGIQAKSFWIKTIYPGNVCISQYPQAEQELIDRKLIVYISAGNNSLFIVPNFKEYSLAEIKANLTYNNITLDILSGEREQCNLPDCYVIDQKPLPGSIVDMNKPLKIQLQVNS